MKLAKNQANIKQHPEAKLLLFEKYSLSSSTLSSKRIDHIVKKQAKKNKCVCIHKILRLITMKMKKKNKNESHKYDINRPRPRHGHKLVNIKDVSL